MQKSFPRVHDLKENVVVAVVCWLTDFYSFIKYFFSYITVAETIFTLLNIEIYISMFSIII